MTRPIEKPINFGSCDIKKAYPGQLGQLQTGFWAIFLTALLVE